MNLALSGEGLALLIAMVAVAGLAAGFLSGLLGVGGGGVLVPVLYEAFGLAGVTEDVRMHLALGTTLAVIAPTVLRSFAAHRARGAVDMDAVRRMAPGVALGVVAGAVIADGSSSETLRLVWIVFGSLLALKMAIGGEGWRLAGRLPGPAGLGAVSVLFGVVSTLMGIGGATFTVPYLTLHGLPLLRAVATATGIGAVIAVPGLIGYIWSGWNTAGLPAFSAGYVSLAALLIAPLSVVAAPFGVRLAHGLSKRKLELAFAVFLASVVLRFAYSLWG